MVEPRRCILARMLNWFLSQHWLLIIVVVVGAFVGLGIGLLSIVQRRILPRFGTLGEQNEVTASVHHGILMMYGLAVALLAVAVWEKNSGPTASSRNRTNSSTNS